MKKKVYDKEEMSLEDFKAFIKKVYRGVYSDRYTLDESSWVDKDTPMRIYCKNHGWFNRIPMEFAHGYVCPYESNAMAGHPGWPARAFIEKATIKYGNRFIYYPDEFVNSKTLTRITCKKHGDFNVTPEHHLCRVSGGCPECDKENMHNHFVKSNEDFIKDSIKVWGEGVFDYNNLNYIDRNSHVTLTCKKHNITFEQTAYKHLLHHKQCPECLREDNIERNLQKNS